jgi:hypothetical protein
VAEAKTRTIQKTRQQSSGTEHLEKAIIDQQQKTIDHLSKYICGNL